MHIASLIHFFASSTGWATAIVCLILYAKNRKRLSLELTVFAASLTFMVGGIAVNHYGRVAGLDLQFLSLLISGGVGSNLFIIIIPPLVHHLFGQEFRGLTKTAFVVIDCAVVIASILYLSVLQSMLLLVVLQAALYLIIVYGLLFSFIKIHDSGVKAIRRFLYALFGTTVIFLPFLALDTFMSASPVVPYNLTLPIFLLVLSIEIAVFAVSYLDQPAFIEGNHLTAHCIETLRLSAREREIVESLLKGHTNKEISDELFISLKTVENHLYNIYQKAGVKNRTQLVNLIHTNSAA